VTVDLLGHGRSIDHGRIDDAIDAHVDAIDGVLRSVGADGDRVCVAAVSMAGAVALRWAANRVRLDRGSPAAVAAGRSSAVSQCATPRPGE